MPETTMTTETTVATSTSLGQDVYGNPVAVEAPTKAAVTEATDSVEEAVVENKEDTAESAE